MRLSQLPPLFNYSLGKRTAGTDSLVVGSSSVLFVPLASPSTQRARDASLCHVGADMGLRVCARVSLCVCDSGHAPSAFF